MGEGTCTYGKSNRTRGSLPLTFDAEIKKVLLYLVFLVPTTAQGAQETNSPKRRFVSYFLHCQIGTFVSLDHSPMPAKYSHIIREGPERYVHTCRYFSLSVPTLSI